MSGKTWGAESYHSKDFDWDELRQEVERDASLRFHLLPYESISGNNFNNDDADAYKDPQAWDGFHARHFTGRFFKERRYLLKEFPELASCREHCTVLEVGCGNGSTVLPILRAHESITLYACDCSSEALDRTKEIISDANLISSKHRFHPFMCDFSTTGFPSWLTSNSCSGESLQNHSTGFTAGENEGNDAHELKCSSGGVDFVTMIFTLSAVPYDKMPKAIAECFAVLKPGGLLLFRDYGIYDMTMLRFKPEQRIGYREYRRSDGTRSYFFCLDTVRDLISAAGFNELELEYCRVKSLNRWNGKTMKRVWIHGKFQKPTFAP